MASDRIMQIDIQDYRGPAVLVLRGILQAIRDGREIELSDRMLGRVTITRAGRPANV